MIIRTPHDTFYCGAAYQSEHSGQIFYDKNESGYIQNEDYVDDVKEVMARKRFRDFPIVDGNGKLLGLISRRRLLNVRKKTSDSCRS